MINGTCLKTGVFLFRLFVLVYFAIKDAKARKIEEKVCVIKNNMSRITNLGLTFIKYHEFLK